MWFYTNALIEKLKNQVAPSFSRKTPEIILYAVGLYVNGWDWKVDQRLGSMRPEGTSSRLTVSIICHSLRVSAEAFLEKLLKADGLAFQTGLILDVGKS